MMPKNEDWFRSAFQVLEQSEKPSDLQKERMLDRILSDSSAFHCEPWISKAFFHYPWRIAFFASAAQALLCTAIFGRQYTNLILHILGG